MTDTPTRETYVGYTQEDLRREIVIDEAMIERAAEVVADETPSTYSQKRVFEIAERVLRAALEVTGGQ